MMIGQRNQMLDKMLDVLQVLFPPLLLGKAIKKADSTERDVDDSEDPVLAVGSMDRKNPNVLVPIECSSGMPPEVLVIAVVANTY